LVEIPWVEVALLQSTSQIPGIYIDLTNSKLTTFDHVESSIIRMDDKGICVRIKNSTIYPTTYSVFVDSNKNKPMGWNNYSHFQKVDLKGNEEKIITLKKYP
jgi:hypothetical protein